MTVTLRAGGGFRGAHAQWRNPSGGADEVRSPGISRSGALQQWKEKDEELGSELRD
jgi:hypothetical protein